MIQLKEYYIQPSGKYLIINTEVNQQCQHTTSGTYDGVYISEMQISLKGDYIDDTTTQTTLYTQLSAALTTAGITHTIVTNPTTGVKHISFTGTSTIGFRIEMDIDSISDKAPFYIKLTALDPNSICTTCAYQNPVQAVTFYKYPLYKRVACAANELHGCLPPQQFMDYLMIIKALEASIEVMDTESINKYFKWLIKGSFSDPSTSTHRPCGCSN